MQKLQLYISGERVDLFKDEQVSISLSQQDVKDPAKIFAEFTKTFTIPASKNNNKIFDHYYNFDIINGFDARNKVSSNIELNNIPYKQGFVALNGVELKNNKALQELQGKRGSPHFVYVNRTLIGLLGLMNSLQAGEIEVQNYKKYIPADLKTTET